MTDETLEGEMEEALRVAFAARFKGRQPTPEWMTALAMRAGTHGEVATLEDAGKAIGKTRERVRQITKEMKPHLQGAALPHLSPVLEVLVRESPVAEPIGRLLSRSGLSRPSLTGGALLNFLELIGVTATQLVGTDLIQVDGWLVEESEAAVMSALPTAKKHTASYGMTTVEEIRQELSSTIRVADPDDIRRVLEAEPSVKWEGEWLWVEKRDKLHSNRLINTARSILSVNSPQTAASIHEGCRRLWRFRKLDILPPVEAVRGFLSVSPYFIVQGDLVRAVEPLDYHEVLGDVTVTVVDVLKATPHQIMDRTSLMETCLEAGVPNGTIAIWSTYAEWLELVARNVIGLRGSRPSPAAVRSVQEAATARRNAEPQRKEWAWGTEGRIVQTMYLTTSALHNGVLNLSSEVRAMLGGRAFQALSGDEPIGTVKVDNGFCWGWRQVFGVLGAKPGQVLQIQFDPVGDTANVRIGAGELWG